MRAAAVALLAASSAAWAALADPLPRGFSLVPLATAEALSSLPPGPARAAVLRSADRQLDRAPHAMPRVHVEGTLPGKGIYDQSLEALRDFPAARDLALAARLTGEARYAEAATRLIGSWIATYEVSFNPIDETGFEPLMIAWDLLPKERRAGLEAGYGRLLQSFSRGYLDRPLKGQTATNNWNSHRAKLIVLAAFGLGDPELIAEAHAAYASQLLANIRADGSTLDFELRDAIHYVVYDLEPLATAALAARQHGKDWLGDVDHALGRAFAWLEPYAAGRRTHEEFANTRIGFDRTRRDAGVKGFEGAFDPRKARTAMALAARLDPRFLDTAKALRTEAWQEAWLELLIPLER